MTDDTTTWLKKNPVVNPLRRSLKTSFRFHVPSSDMDASIISNPDKGKDQQIFIPRMLQRSNMRTLKLRTHEFKVPQMVVAKSSSKKNENSSIGSGVKSKKIPIQPRKSCLPVPNSKSQIPERKSVISSIKRPSFAPGGSGQRTAKRQVIQKMVELSQLSRNRKLVIPNHLKVVPDVTADNSIPRSILKKKRASLRRTSKISTEKPKAKKVLFNGFESSDTEEKENDASTSFILNQTEKEKDSFAALDEPTVFLHFSNSQKKDDTPVVGQSKEERNLNCFSTEDETKPADININSIINIFMAYKKNVDNLESVRTSWENSLESFLQQSDLIRDAYVSYRKNSEEIYGELSKLGEKLEDSLKATLASGQKSEKMKTRLSGRKGSDKVEKIKISDKSKAIKKSSGKKSFPPLKNGARIDMEESFNLINKKSFLEN